MIHFGPELYVSRRTKIGGSGLLWGIGFKYPNPPGPYTRKTCGNSTCAANHTGCSKTQKIVEIYPSIGTLKLFSLHYCRHEALCKILQVYVNVSKFKLSVLGFCKILSSFVNGWQSHGRNKKKGRPILYMAHNLQASLSSHFGKRANFITCNHFSDFVVFRPLNLGAMKIDTIMAK